MTGRPIVILTALDLEYAAVQKKLKETRPYRHPKGTRFEVGRLGDGQTQVALALVGKGTQSAAVLAERAMSSFDPAAVIFVGVAGALRHHVALGDVVVATHVYAYHGGTSEDDGLMGRPRVWEISHDADQAARHVVRAGSWAEGLSSSPRVHFGPLAAGEVVLNSRTSAHARWLREHYNDALAIEMEAAGVAQAAQLNRSLPVVIVRGISDRADGTKTLTDADDWQPRAVTGAAALATALAEELGGQVHMDGFPGARPNTGHDRTADGGATFTINGGSRIGVVANVINGGVWQNAAAPAEPDLAVELSDLRRLVERAHQGGRLDDDVYAAARDELAAAEDSFRTRATRGLVVALKKLAGLVDGAADLAAKVAAVIAVAQGLS
jgi:adenosylhomocysteine nucleosidase